MAESRDFSTTWVEFELIQVGGGYAYQIGIIEDKATQARKVRVAKGRIIAQEDGRAAVKQAQKLNLKSKEWPKVREAIEKYLGKLQASGQEEQESADEKE
jgi:hypothetical protein